MVNNHIFPSIWTVREAWKSRSKKRRRRSIIREFALNTSTHGLPGIARSRSKFNCSFWAISFLIFTGIMVYFITESIKIYFHYPTQTSISIIMQRAQVFPAVTFCNYAPARYDLVIGPLLNYINSNNVTNTSDPSTLTTEQYSLLGAFLQQQINAGHSVSHYFFSLDIMLMDCNYNGQTCTTNDFISFLSYNHGLCYTFNAKLTTENGTKTRNTNDNGGAGKLVLRLYAHSHLYVPCITKGLFQKRPTENFYFLFPRVDASAGMVAMVHDNRELPPIDIVGIELGTGRKHKVGYRTKANHFLSSPYTKCTRKIPPGMKEVYSQYPGTDYAYSQGICYTLCIQAYV